MRVKSERPTREQLIELAKTDPEAIADLVLALLDRIEILEAKVAALERNSRTSSKPPSSDKGNFGNPPKPKSRRSKTGRKRGGQKGHRGEKKLCPWCGTAVRAGFPEGVNAPVQYGPGVQAAALYLGGYQLIPYQRLSETFAELLGCPLSPGTLANFVKRGGKNAAAAMVPVRDALVRAPVAHADETGCTLHPRRDESSVGCRHDRADAGCQRTQRSPKITPRR